VCDYKIKTGAINLSC